MSLGRRLRFRLAVLLAPQLRPDEYEVQQSDCLHPDPVWSFRMHSEGGRWYGYRCLDCGISGGANFRSPYMLDGRYPFGERL